MKRKFEKPMDKKEAILNAKTFDKILDIEYGKIGTEARDEFEENARLFIISEMSDAGL